MTTKPTKAKSNSPDIILVVLRFHFTSSIRELLRGIYHDIKGFLKKEMQFSFKRVAKILANILLLVLLLDAVILVSVWLNGIL